MDPGVDHSSSPKQNDSLKRNRSKRDAIRETLDGFTANFRSGRPSSQSRSSPVDVRAGIAQVGHVSGALGGEAAIQAAKSRAATRDKIRQGTEVFVRALNIATEEAQSFRSESTVSLNGIAVADLKHDAHDENPITSPVNNNNPFEWSSDESSNGSEDSDPGPFVENIVIPGTQDIFMRALLDTGMKVNAMSLDSWKQTGFDREEYLGRQLVTADGAKFKPLGQVRIRFYFRKRHAAKTWKVRFLIVPDGAPFDVALGRRFIKRAQLLEKNEEAFPLGMEKLTPQEHAEMRRKTEALNQQQQEIKQRQLEEMKERRKRDKQRERQSRGSHKP